MLVRASALTLVVCCWFPAVSGAVERLQVPGGTSRLREVTELPASVTDAMLLAEAARAWYGSKDPITNPPIPLRRLLEFVRSADEPLAPGPVLPLTPAVWTDLLSVSRSSSLVQSLVSNRNAMLLYYGLVGMDDATLEWMQGHPALLKAVLRDGAPAFAFAGPSVRVRDGAVEVVGGASARAAWESVVGESASNPEAFIARLMQRHAGRLAWLYSSLDQLDAPRARFALAGGERALKMLMRQATAASPEWIVAERPFWRPAFDLTLVLALVDLRADGTLRGSEGFWREVFRGDDLDTWKASPPQSPLSADALVELLFDQPYFARDRWEVFCLGQRIPGVERDLEASGLLLRGARRHPALAQMLDRIGSANPETVLRMHRASARVSGADPDNAKGELGAWQGILAIIERSALTGGLDRAAVEEALSELAALPLENIRAELTAWVMKTWLPRLAARPGAPQDADRLVLQTMSGRLTRSGARRETRFTWEDLAYSIGTPRSLVGRMEDAQAAQGSATLEEARALWRTSEGNTAGVDALLDRLRLRLLPRGVAELAERLSNARKNRDAPALVREARRSAETIACALVAAFPYAPHLAVTETPALGAEIAYRHEFVAPDDGGSARQSRPWQVARGQARAGAGWHLEGSLLLLDLALADWYLRRNGEPPAAAPLLDERDVIALAQVAAIARSGGAQHVAVDDVCAGVAAGRQSAKSAATAEELDRRLAEAGIDPWRRRALRLESSTLADTSARLTPAEAWRLAGAPGRLAPQPPLDGSARLGPVPHSTLLMEGRRSAGAIGATAIDTQLRVAEFLHDRQLPSDLFGEIAAGALSDVIETAAASRPDDYSAFAAAMARLDDNRMEEHLLSLVRDGTLTKPPSNQPD